MPDPATPVPLPSAPAPQPSAPTARRPLQEVASDPSSVPVEQRALLVRLSQEVAALRAALDLSRHRIATLEVEASQDPVSGLMNQRAFLREIEKAVAFQTRYQTASAVALIAIDGVDGVADRHGQAIANRLLRTVGERIRSAIRSCDMAARLDPYRVGIVLWNATASDCDARLAGVCTAIGGMDTLLEGRVAAVAVRAAAVAIEAGDSPDSLLARIEPKLGCRAKRQR